MERKRISEENGNEYRQPAHGESEQERERDKGIIRSEMMSQGQVHG